MTDQSDGLPRAAADTPLVSIIVPICNVGRYLPQCLDAILSQSLHDIEVIAIDDGSTDDSTDILLAYAEHDPRIRALVKRNEGYGTTVNRGIELARGRYVGLVEPDDWPEPDMFEKLYRCASANDCDMVKCDFYDTFEDGERPRHNLRGLPRNKTYDVVDQPQTLLITPSIWAALYRRSFLLDNGIRCRQTPGAAFQDCAFSLKCLSSARRFRILDEPLLHYRRDNPNASSKTSGKLFSVADEFEDARRYLDGMPQRRDAILPWFRLHEWRNYRWDYERIAYESRVAYLERVCSEMRDADGSGEIRYDLFEDWEVLRLKMLVHGGAELFHERFPESFADKPRYAGMPDAADDYLVSIVVPAYNDARFVSRSVASCLAQTHRNIEVICVDDCSSDDTLNVMHSLALSDGRVSVIGLERNSGEHNARLAGVRSAHGDIIVFLDGDDELSKEACEDIVSSFVADPVDILHFSTVVKSDGSTSRSKVRELEAWMHLERKTLVGREILDECFVGYDHPHNVCGKAFPAQLVKRAFEQVGEFRADRGVDGLEYFAIAYNALTYRSEPRLRGYVYHFGNGESSREGMGPEAFAHPMQTIRAIEGMRTFLERQATFDEYGYLYRSHLVGQSRSIVLIWHRDVRDDCKDECLEMLLDSWPRECIVDALCEHGSLAVEHLFRVEGADAALSPKQIWTWGYADGGEETRAEYEVSKSYRLGRAMTSIPRTMRDRL